MIRGAIFDADGTLLDSMSLWDTLGADYLRSLGYQPRENLNETFKNMSMQQAARYYQIEYGVTLSIEEIIRDVNRRIEDFYRNQAGLKPGVPAFLGALREKGVRMCVATATDRPLIHAALERCGAAMYFSEIFTCTSVGHGKDEPEIYRQALAHLGTPKEKTVVFEDALYAMRTVKADGFPAAAVFDRYETGQRELAGLADVFLRDYIQLEDFWEFASAL